MSEQIPSHVITDAGSISQALKAGAALGFARRADGTQDAAPYAVIPRGFDLVATPTIATPKRPQATVRLRDAASFIRFWSDHAVARSRIYATMEPARFLAVIDEFDFAVESPNVDEQADWRAFRAEFLVPASREWTTWTAVHRKDMGQLAFAEFLQDNLPDIVQPEGASLLEMCLNFEAVTGGKVVATQRLQDGSVSLQFQAENIGGASVKLPDVITLSIPVFENEKPVEMQARLKYRIKREDGSISFRIELVRAHKVLEQAFREVWARIEGAGAVVLLGTPE